MTDAAMTDSQFLGAWIVGALTLWFLAVLFALGLGKAAGRRRPKPEPDPFVFYFLGAELPITRPDLDAAHTAVATAEAIVRAEYEAAS